MSVVLLFVNSYDLYSVFYVRFNLTCGIYTTLLNTIFLLTIASYIIFFHHFFMLSFFSWAVIAFYLASIIASLAYVRILQSSPLCRWPDGTLVTCKSLCRMIPFLLLMALAAFRWPMMLSTTIQSSTPCSTHKELASINRRASWGGVQFPFEFGWKVLGIV